MHDATRLTPSWSAPTKVDGGWLKRYRHRSGSLDCDMVFAIYLPPQAEQGPVPMLWWLSGLTCTDENFMQKAGAQRKAAELGIALICPDTSPRGVDLPGEDDSYDFGSGAGFYVNATREPWARHYRMYDYVTEELPALVKRHFPVDGERESIYGHSMGGHGALICALKNPGPLSLGLRLRADRQSDGLPVGREGLQRLSSAMTAPSGRSGIPASWSSRRATAVPRVRSCSSSRARMTSSWKSSSSRSVWRRSAPSRTTR